MTRVLVVAGAAAVSDSEQSLPEDDEFFVKS
jgi:hypothetical protein